MANDDQHTINNQDLQNEEPQDENAQDSPQENSENESQDSKPSTENTTKTFINDEDTSISDASEVDEEQLTTELMESQFKHYGHNIFQEFIDKDYDYQDFVRICEATTAYKIPASLSDVFFNAKLSVFYIVANTPIMSRYEEWIKDANKHKGIYSENFMEIKKSYINWAIATNDKDQEYHGLSTLRLIEKNTNNDNFIKLMFAGIIHTYDKSMRSIDTAIDMYTIAEETCLKSTMEEGLKQEFYNLIHIYKGLSYYSGTRYDQALQSFQEVNNTSVMSVTSLFYFALMQKKLGNPEGAINALKIILKYDIDRLVFALEQQNLRFFNFFFENAAIYNVFKEKEFSSLLPSLKTMIDTYKAEDFGMFSKMNLWVSRLKNQELQEHFDKQMDQVLSFISSLLSKYQGYKNVLLLMVSENLIHVFHQLTEHLRERVNKAFKEKLNKELGHFRAHITEIEKQIDDLREETRVTKEKYEKQYEDTKEKLNEKVEKKRNEVKKLLKKLLDEDETKPKNLFKSAIIKNLLLAVVMTVIGIMVQLIIHLNQSSQGFSNALSESIGEGVIWGVIIFFLGMLVTTMGSFSKVSQNRLERRRLTNQLTKMERAKNEELERISKELKKRANALEDVNKKKIEDLKRNIEKIEIEMKEVEMRVRREIDKEKKELLSKFQNVFEN